MTRARGAARARTTTARRPSRRYADTHGVTASTREIIDLIGWRRTVGVFASGGMLAFIVSIAGTLVVFGGERRTVLDKVALVEPMQMTLATHTANEVAHLDATEANLVAVMPVKFVQVERHLDSIDDELRAMRRAVEDIQRRLPSAR
jgi:hypothetical protein